MKSATLALALVCSYLLHLNMETSERLAALEAKRADGGFSFSMDTKLDEETEERIKQLEEVVVKMHEINATGFKVYGEQIEEIRKKVSSLIHMFKSKHNVYKI